MKSPSDPRDDFVTIERKHLEALVEWADWAFGEWGYTRIDVETSFECENALAAARKILE